MGRCRLPSPRRIEQTSPCPLSRPVWKLGAMEMEATKRWGYAWAISAGLNAALAAVSAKVIPSLFVKYGLVIIFNVTMWGCYVNSMKALSSLQATVTNFATNFLSSGLAGFFLFKEALPLQWFTGALLIVIGVLILSKSSIERKTAHAD